MRRFLAVAVLVLIPAVASAQQSFNLSLGGFSPRAEDARNGNDVLVKSGWPKTMSAGALFTTGMRFQISTRL